MHIKENNTTATIMQGALPEIFEDTGFKWHELFSELFVPNEEIQSAINGTGFKAKSYIAIHLRFVNALDNFELGYDNGLKNERQKEDLIYRCKSAIQSITDKAGNKRVLVFSDSKRFLMSLADLPVTILDPSAIGHISFSGAHNQIAKTFLDFYMIARAAKVYRIAAKEMYLSSCFAMCAARAGNAEYFSVIV